MWPKTFCIALALLCLSGANEVAPEQNREEVNWRLPGGVSIRAIQYPSLRTPHVPMQDRSSPGRVHRQVLPPEAKDRVATARAKYAAKGRSQQPTGTALIVDSPAIDGFVPWIAVSVTGEHDQIYATDAIPKSTVGSFLPGRQADYAIGVMDTGASAHVMGNASATRVGMFSGNPDYVTSSNVDISGVTGSVTAWVSTPIGLYIDGLQAIDPTLLTLTTSGMLGETNVAVAVGKPPPLNQPDLATVIGTPLSVFYAAVVANDQPITRTISSTVYTGPQIHFYQVESPSIPDYASLVPLELRPLGSSAVQYVPCVQIFGGDCPDGDGSPQSPSIIVGNSSQSLFFVSSVDMYDGNKSAIDKNRFIIDTGAQVTVIGQRVGARLAVNPNNPDFEVEIEGVDGSSIMAPGFYVDRVDIPALGEWLSFTNVPVVLLDVASPEGGTLDGIIGMNLLTNYNFVLRGGGLTGMDDPSLECSVIIPGLTYCDYDNDHDVDQDDFGHLQRCYTGPDQVQSNPNCQDALLDADSDVDDADVQIFINCTSGPAIPASDNCAP